MGGGVPKPTTGKYVGRQVRQSGSIQVVSGDTPTLPWVRSRVWVGAELGLGLGLALWEGWVDTSPESWIDPFSKFASTA